MTGSGNTEALEHWSPIQASSCGRYDARSRLVPHFSSTLASQRFHAPWEGSTSACSGSQCGSWWRGWHIVPTDRDVTWICIFDAGKLKPKYLFKKLFIL